MLAPMPQYGLPKQSQGTPRYTGGSEYGPGVPGDDEATIWGQSQSGNTTKPHGIFACIIRPDLEEVWPNYEAIFSKLTAQGARENPKQDYTRCYVISVDSEYKRSCIQIGSLILFLTLTLTLKES